MDMMLYLKWYEILILALSLGILTVYGIYLVRRKEGDYTAMIRRQPAGDVYWRVQLAAFRIKDNAQALQNVLSVKGFKNVRIIYEENWYKVIVAEVKSVHEAHEWLTICGNAGHNDVYIYDVPIDKEKTDG